MMRHIDGVREVAHAFDALIVDQFGVLHDGTRAYPEAADCLVQLHRAGKRLVVLSNSGRRASVNLERLGSLGFDTSLFHAVITSGEIAWRALSERPDAFHRSLGPDCYVIAEGDPDEFLGGLDFKAVDSVKEADFLLVIGIETPRRSLDDYEPILQEGIQRGLPMLSANSDLVRFTRSGLQPAPGVLAQRYAELGGVVRGYGKPLPAIFLDSIELLDGTERGRVLAVGDSLEHDILGANRAGIASLLIRGGIGRGTSAIEVEKVARQLGVTPEYCADQFVW